MLPSQPPSEALPSEAPPCALVCVLLRELEQILAHAPIGLAHGLAARQLVLVETLRHLTAKCDQEKQGFVNTVRFATAGSTSLDEPAVSKWVSPLRTGAGPTNHSRPLFPLQPQLVRPGELLATSAAKKKNGERARVEKLNTYPNLHKC